MKLVNKARLVYSHAYMGIMLNSSYHQVHQDKGIVATLEDDCLVLRLGDNPALYIPMTQVIEYELTNEVSKPDRPRRQAKKV